MKSHTQIPSTPARSVKSLSKPALAYPSPASTPGSSPSSSSLRGPNALSANDWDGSPLTPPPPTEDATLSGELKMNLFAKDFLPPPWDSEAYEKSMPKIINGHIPRPPNSFMLFRSHVLKNVIAEQMHDHQQNASRIAGGIWKNADFPEYIKAAWCERAKIVQRWHSKKFPEYKFTPRKASPKAVGKVDEDEEEDKCQKYLKRYFNTASPIPRSSSKRKQPRSLRRVFDSDDDDDDDEYLPIARMRSLRRSARRSKTPHPQTTPSTPKYARAGRSSASYRATPSSYPSPPVTPHLSPAQRISTLLQYQSAIRAELSRAHAELSSALASPATPPSVNLPLPGPQFSFPPLPSLPSLSDFGAIQAANGSMNASGSSSYQSTPSAPYASTSQQTLPAPDVFEDTMFGMHDIDVFGPVIPNISSTRSRRPTFTLQDYNEVGNIMNSFFDIDALPDASAAPVLHPSSGADFEDVMASFFDFSQFPAAQGGNFEGSS